MKIVCKKCGRVMSRISQNNKEGVLSHPKTFLCGTCKPKQFSDTVLEQIMKDFMEV